ncbi:1-phosphofructokinase family hexose kinase [Methylomarinum vadi]|uniref:1-phosphofructokinase family hexose kinase n=1 Tax=Methylomarinum vadi TaxID=438855 RepID=UPI00056860A7|nr:1-phosphofructokinase family hexose kinase [Methylomarinum vadi]
MHKNDSDKGKIITITVNTALDLYIEIEGLAHNDNIVAQSNTEFACGKGVNVARGVASLSIAVTCLGFVGQQSLPTFEALDSEFIQTDFTAVEGKTRTNITLFDRTDNRETHIRTKGYTVNAEDCRHLKDKLAALLTPNDIVVLSGSLPPGMAPDWYAEMIELCRGKRATALLDSSGNAMNNGLAAKPYLIKPNQQELEQIVGAPLKNEAEIVSAARGLVEQGIHWIYVSRGAQGVVVVGRRVAMAANIVDTPSRILTHIGCGDAMVAGLAVATRNGESLENTVKTSIACGVANLYSREPGKFEQKLQQEMMSKIAIRSL